MQKNESAPPVPVDPNYRSSATSHSRIAAAYTTSEMKELFELASAWAAEGIDLGILARFLVFRLLERTRKMTGAIEEAFAGQPFNPNLAPHSPENQRRFKSYLENHFEVSRFLLELVNLAMIDPGPRVDSGSRSKKDG